MTQKDEIGKFLQVDNENCPSGTSTPVFTWSPLPPRKHLSFPKDKETKSKCDSSIKLYPNCDVNVWLRSCEKEIIDPIQGELTGDIPEWLNGSLIRNGPGSLKVGEEELFTHLFDSSALLHRFGINNGKITYQCRFLQSDVFQKSWSAKRIVLTGFGTRSVEDPCHSIFQRIAAVFSKETSDNALISVYPFGDELYAFTETPVIHKINVHSLETEGRVNLDEHISIVNHTSHPHVLKDDPDNTMFDNGRIVATFPSRWRFNPSYMHSFGITDNFFVVAEQPLCISVMGMVETKIMNQPLAGCFRWYHEELTRICLLSRKTGKLAYVFYAEAFFYLHFINQYEDDGHVVLDICIYKDPAMLDCMYVDTMKSMQQNPDYAKMFRGRPARFVLPLNPVSPEHNIHGNLVKLSGTKAKAFYIQNGDILVEPEKLCKLGCETPRINYEIHMGKPYRYFYAISSDVDGDNPGTVIKVDTFTKTTKSWNEKNCYPSEPIFVARPKPKFEDDGVVLSALVWGEDDTNHVGLLVLDAITFVEIGRAEFRTPSPVPKCLHGWFLPQIPREESHENTS